MLQFLAAYKFMTYYEISSGKLEIGKFHTYLLTSDTKAIGKTTVASFPALSRNAKRIIQC